MSTETQRERARTNVPDAAVWLRVFGACMVAVLLAIALFAAARLVWWATTQQISFDGAMNLEVARSLAEGHGYQRMYAGHSGFAHEIQTRAPFILPAAAVFTAFGVGIWQAQLTNLLYALAMTGIVFVMVRRVSGWRFAIAAMAFALTTPAIEAVGMNGYGELPALTWWLASLLFLFTDAPAGSASAGRRFAAGVMIGIAVVTKTVLLIGVVASLVPFVLLCRDCNQSPREILRAVAIVVAGMLLPIVAHELWRAASIGGIAHWLHWLSDEMTAVHSQAGTHVASDGMPHAISKAHTHFGILANETGVHAGLLAGALISIAWLAASALRRMLPSPERSMVLALLAFAGIYLTWWLLLTPTPKAWYRRVFDGMIALEIAAVIVIAQAWHVRARLARSARVAAVIAVAILAVFEIRFLSRSFSPRAFPPDDATAQYTEDVNMIEQLPREAHLYGVGWYAAPRIALYGGRYLGDLMHRTPAQLHDDANAYLVVDIEAMSLNIGNDWLSRFNGKLVAQTPRIKVYRLDTSLMHAPFSKVTVDRAALRDEIDFRKTNYPYLEGFFDKEGDGWRWAAPEAAVLLRHQDEDHFVMDVYTLPDDAYAMAGPIGIDVSIDGCHLGTWRQTREGGQAHVRFALAPCVVAPDSAVSVQLAADRVVADSNDRSVAYIVNALGFEKAPAAK